MDTQAGKWLQAKRQTVLQQWLDALRASGEPFVSTELGQLQQLLDAMFEELTELAFRNRLQYLEKLIPLIGPFPSPIHYRDLATLLLTGRRIVLDMLSRDGSTSTPLTFRLLQTFDEAFTHLHFFLLDVWLEASAKSSVPLDDDYTAQGLSMNHAPGDANLSSHVHAPSKSSDNGHAGRSSFSPSIPEKLYPTESMPENLTPVGTAEVLSKEKRPSRLNLLYNAFEHSTDGILITDLDGNIIEVNKAFLDMFGYRYEELIGQNTRILKSPHSTPELYREMWNSINSTGQWKGEIVNRRKDGTEIPNYLSITPIYEAGQRVGYMGVEIDITAQKQVEEALRREKEFSDSLLENANSLIVGLDLKGNIIIFNGWAQKVTGYTKEEVLGKNWFELFIPPQTRSAVDEVFHKIISARLPTRFENSILTKSGEERLMAWNNTVIRNEKHEVVGALGIGEDITESRRLQGQLLQAERLAIIGQMAAKVAHEIRNPLSSISLNAELIQDELQNLPPQEIDEAKSLLDSIIAEVDRVTNLTEEYLQFSRLPAIHFQTHDLHEWLDDLVIAIEPELSAKGIQLICEVAPDLPRLVFDPQQMRRVMLNLVRNAIEAMPKGGFLTIAARTASNFVEITVTDTGPGVAAEVISRIFEPFYTTKDMGTGLGLALSQQIVNEHGGTIHCESPVFTRKDASGDHVSRGGARFVIRLPINRSRETREEV